MTFQRYEQSEINLLATATIHDIIAIRIRAFQLETGVLPQRVFLAMKSRSAFTVELIRFHRYGPEHAVLVPVMLQGFGKDIPLFYSPLLGDNWLVLDNTGIGVTMSL